MMYLLGRSQRPRLFRPARIEDRGGRVNRRRCARWRRFPSDCRMQTHSDMGDGVWCRNFSKDVTVLVVSDKRDTRQALPTTAKRNMRAGSVLERAERRA